MSSAGANTTVPVPPCDLVLDLGEIVESLSAALNLCSSPGSGAFSAHGRRVAYIAASVGDAMGACGVARDTLLYGGHLHDCGVTNDRSRLALVDPLAGQMAAHTVRGARLLGRSSVLAFLAPAVLAHHDWYDGTEGSSDLPGPDVPLAGRILHLADRVDVLVDPQRFPVDQREVVRAWVRQRSGTMFDPAVVAAWEQCCAPEAFWFGLHHANEDAGRLRRATQQVISIEQLEEIALVFALIVDAKSEFTFEHSLGVARVVEALVQACAPGLCNPAMVRIAGYLHDLGKLGVPDTILDKQGPLTVEEFARTKRHAYDTYRILSGIRGLEFVAEWAAFHHERVDGHGYPFQVAPPRLALVGRAMAVADIFQALFQRRPYRPALEPAGVKSILNDMVRDGALDGDVVYAVFADFDMFRALALGTQESGNLPDRIRHA